MTLQISGESGDRGGSLQQPGARGGYESLLTFIQIRTQQSVLRTQSGAGNIIHYGILQFPGSNVQLILARLTRA